MFILTLQATRTVKLALHLLSLHSCKTILEEGLLPDLMRAVCCLSKATFSSWSPLIMPHSWLLWALLSALIHCVSKFWILTCSSATRCTDRALYWRHKALAILKLVASMEGMFNDSAESCKDRPQTLALHQQAISALFKLSYVGARSLVSLGSSDLEFEALALPDWLESMRPRLAPHCQCNNLPASRRRSKLKKAVATITETCLYSESANYRIIYKLMNTEIWWVWFVKLGCRASSMAHSWHEWMNIFTVLWESGMTHGTENSWHDAFKRHVNLARSSFLGRRQPTHHVRHKTISSPVQNDSARWSVRISSQCQRVA